MASFQSTGYKLDIVYVIDGTNNGSIIDAVKDKIKKVPEIIDKIMTAAMKPLDSIREKLVFFGDYTTDGKNAIVETEFFNVPEDNEKFNAQFERDDIRMNGGDPAENGLEALFTAMCSEWVKLASREKGRHIIVVISDAYPLKLMERKECVDYPVDEFPPDITELEHVWNDCDPDNKLSYNYRRLILCVPEGMDYHEHTWEDVFAWQNTIAMPVERNEDCKEIDEDDLVFNLVVDIVRDI